MPPETFRSLLICQLHLNNLNVNFLHLHFAGISHSHDIR